MEISRLAHQKRLQRAPKPASWPNKLNLLLPNRRKSCQPEPMGIPWPFLLAPVTGCVTHGAMTVAERLRFYLMSERKPLLSLFASSDVR
jgi:hypothetical protein